MKCSNTYEYSKVMEVKFPHAVVICNTNYTSKLVET